MKLAAVILAGLAGLAGLPGLAAPAPAPSPSPVAAGALADALARHGSADVAALRGQPGAAARCTLGAIYARRADLPRADLYLTGCDDAELPAEVAAAIARARRDVRRALDASALSRIEVVSIPAGLPAQIDALPGETFTTPQTVWVKAGRYELRATRDGMTYASVVSVGARARTSGIIEIPQAAPRAARAARPRQVDFSDAGAGERQSGSPAAVDHGSMLKGKWAGRVAAAGGGGDELRDPLAARGELRGPRASWLGLRLGGGLFDDAAADARPGIALAAAARHRVRGDAFLAGRLDWSRRGGAASGDPAGAVSAIGVAAGAGVTVVGRRALALALIGQLRADVRFADSRPAAGGGAAPVRRAGLAAAAGAELALPGTPFSAGLRFEHGLTELAPAARDRALLLEIGVDWR